MACSFTVEDDGLGFDVAATDRGYGLPNMRQRAEELGGTFSVESKPGAGTRGGNPCAPAGANGRLDGRGLGRHIGAATGGDEVWSP